MGETQESSEESNEGVYLTHGLNNNDEYKAKMAKRKFQIDMSHPNGSIGRQCGYSAQVPFNSNMLSESSNYQNKHAADEALYIGKDLSHFTHTNVGRGQWFKAKLGGKKHVLLVRIKNRRDCCGDRLVGTEVYVGGKLCGKVGKNPGNGGYAIVWCGTHGMPTIEGDEVKLVTTRNVPLSITKLRVYTVQHCMDNHENF